MGENHSSVMVLRIRPKFWWMLPMGVRDNHTKYEPGRSLRDQIFFLLRAALKDRPKGPPTANRQVKDRP